MSKRIAIGAISCGINIFFCYLSGALDKTIGELAGNNARRVKGHGKIHDPKQLASALTLSMEKS